MRFLHKESILVHKTTLKWDLSYISIWDTDYLGAGKVEKIAEYIKIGRGEVFPLLKPLVLIRPPKNAEGYTKRELGNLISEEMEAHRWYLARVANKLELQIRTILETGKPYFVWTTPSDEPYVWVKLPKKWRFLENLLGGGGAKDDEEPP